MKLKLKVAKMTAADPRDLVEVKAKRHHFTGAGSLSLSQALRSTSFHLWTFLVVESAITEIKRNCPQLKELRRAEIKLQSVGIIFYPPKPHRSRGTEVEF